MSFYEISKHSLIDMSFGVKTIDVNTSKMANDLLEKVFVTNT